MTASKVQWNERAYCHLAAVALKREDVDRAHRLYQQAVSEFRRVGARQGECYAFNALGGVFFKRGELAGGNMFS